MFNRKKMATTRYFIQGKKDPVNIYLSLSVKAGMVIKRKTGFHINKAEWSNETSLPLQRDDIRKKMTATLRRLSVTIGDKLNELTASGGIPSGEWLEHQIDLFNGKRESTDQDRLVNYIQKYVEDLPYKVFPNGRKGATKATIGKYKTLKSKIEGFESHTKKEYFLTDVNITFRNDLLKYFREVDRLGANTAGRYIKFLKTVCLDAQFNGREVNPQLKRVSGFTEKASKIFLNFEELEKIQATKFTRPALENARDWLVVGCYIGQRVSDLLTLTSDNIVTRAGLELIELTQKKTGKFVSIPFHHKVKQIVEKYGGKFPYKICDQKFNEYIKEVCQLAGINQPVYGGKVFKIEEKTYRKEFGTFPKYELVTSHVCRRSFASNFYGDIPTALLIAITAHSTEQQFLAYIGKTADDYAVQLAEYWRKQALQSNQETTLTVVRNVEAV